MYLTDRRYSKEHEWAKPEADNTVFVGITHYAQSQLGDVVYLALPSLGTKLAQFEEFGEVESVKAVSSVYSPVTGTVVGVNEKLASQPELVNQDPHGEGWIIKIEIENLGELDTLLNAEEYEALLSRSEHS